MVVCCSVGVIVNVNAIVNADVEVSLDVVNRFFDVTVWSIGMEVDSIE